MRQHDDRMASAISVDLDVAVGVREELESVEKEPQIPGRPGICGPAGHGLPLYGG